MRRIRKAIDANEVQEFLKEFLLEQFLDGLIPQWVREAVAHLGYEI